MLYPRNWVAGLEGEEKQRFEELLSVNNKVLDRLVEICYNMVNGSETNNSDFDNPNWALRQAHQIGYRKALLEVVKLASRKRDHATE